MGWSVHRKGILTDGLMEWPQRKPTRGFNPTSVKCSPSGKTQSAKEPTIIRTIYYSHVQNMTMRVTQSSCYKIRSLHAVSHRWCYSAGWLTCWNLKLLGWRIPLQAVPDVACVAPGAQKDELILEGNYSELASNSEALIQQPVAVKNKAIRRAVGGSPVSEKGQGHWPKAAFQKASRCRALSRGPPSVRCCENPAL